MMPFHHPFHQIPFFTMMDVAAVHRHNSCICPGLRSSTTGCVHDRFVHIWPTFFARGLSPMRCCPNDVTVNATGRGELMLARPEGILAHVDRPEVRRHVRKACVCAARPGTENPSGSASMIGMLAAHLFAETRTIPANRSIEASFRSRDRSTHTRNPKRRTAMESGNSLLAAAGHAIADWI